MKSVQNFRKFTVLIRAAFNEEFTRKIDLVHVFIEVVWYGSTLEIKTVPV